MTSRFPQGASTPLYNDDAYVNYKIQASKKGKMVYEADTSREKILYDHIAEIGRIDSDYYALTVEVDGREVYQKEGPDLDVIELSVPQAAEEIDYAKSIGFDDDPQDRFDDIDD